MRCRRGSISRRLSRSTRSRRAAATRVGTASRPVLVGGVDLEMTQPRLNEAVLRRLAAETNGRYVVPTGADHLPSLLRESRAEAGTPEHARPLAQWMEPAGMIVGLLAAEWVDAAASGTGVMIKGLDLRVKCVVPSCLLFAASRRCAETRWAVIISGASGGEKYAEQMATWRVRSADRRWSIATGSRPST